MSGDLYFNTPEILHTTNRLLIRYYLCVETHTEEWF